jgi:glycosyltransferase involved in cell wall biosynthesis
MSKVNITKLYYFDFIGTFGGAQQSTVALLNKIDEKYQSLIKTSVIYVAGTNNQFIENLKIPLHRIDMNNSFNIFKVGNKKFQAILYFMSCGFKVKEIIKKDKHANERVVVLCNSSKALYTLFFLKILALDFEIYFYSRGWGKKSGFNIVVRSILNNCVSKILCVSNQTKENMSSYIKDDTKLFVTYTSVDLAQLDEFYIEKPVDTNCLKILFAGAIIPMKGVKELLEAINQLDVNYQKRIELLIAGIDDSPEVLNYVNECKVIAQETFSKVSWLGWRNDIPELISAVDVVCLPSYSEGLPRIIQESMYMGKLVISTPVGGVPSLIEDGVTGYLVQVGSSESIKDALEKCFKDRLVGNISKNARHHINKNFNLDNQVKIVVDSIVHENK